MIEQGLLLSVYLGERDRTAGALLCDALMDLFARAGVRAGVLLRGVEGFGIKHRLQTERLLTLSEDLPVVALAIDRSERIEALVGEVRRISPHGLITLERVRLAAGAVGEPELAPSGDALKLTIFSARHLRHAGRPAYLAAVELLHGHGFAGASVLLGVDGGAEGARLRARLLAGNAEVPLLISAVGAGDRLITAVPALAEMLGDPLIAIERARICKRDGLLLAEPGVPPPAHAGAPAYWQKLVVQTGEQARFERHPIHAALVRRLRREGAAGATSLRALWGYGGEHAPHGERFWSLARHSPVCTVVLDEPERMGRWFAIVDEMTATTGLVTSELVPALRAAGPGVELGGLALAEPRPEGHS